MQNKTIGIIGGVGPQATSYLYSKIIELSQTKHNARNNDEFPHLIIESLPIPDFISNKNDLSVAKEMLVSAINRFEGAKVDRICIASNTVHILLEELGAYTSIKFLSIIDLVTLRCKQNKYKKVALLGTPTLVSSGLYQKSFLENDMLLITPDDTQLEIIEMIIRGVIAGQVPDEQKGKYIEVMNDLYDKGAEAVILGCTELPLAFDYQVLGKRAINSDEVLAEGIVDYYYN